MLQFPNVKRGWYHRVSTLSLTGRCQVYTLEVGFETSLLLGLWSLWASCPLSHSVPREAQLGTGNPLPLDRLLHIHSMVVRCLHLPGAPDLPLLRRMNSWQKHHDLPFWYWAPDSKEWRFPSLEQKHRGEKSSRIRAHGRVRGQSLSLVLCIFILNHLINLQSKIPEWFWEVRSVEQPLD